MSSVVVRWVPVLLAIVVSTCGCRPGEIDDGTRLTYRIDTSRLVAPSASLGEVVQRTVRERLDRFGYRHSHTRLIGGNRLEVSIRDKDPKLVDEVKACLQKTGRLAFRLVAEGPEHDGEKQHARYREREREYDEALAAWTERARAGSGGDPLPPLPTPPRFVVRTGRPRDGSTGPDAKGEELVIDTDPASGLEATFASVGSTVDAFSMKPAVAFELTGDRAEILGGLTRRNEGRRLAIVIDDQVLVAPVIRSTITAHGQITGNFTQRDVDGLIAILRSPPLPAPLVLESEEDIAANPSTPQPR